MRIAGAVLTAVAVVALSLPPSAGVDPPGDRGMRLSSAQTSDGVQRLSTSSTCAVQGDLEDQFTDSTEMPLYLECVLPAVEEWIDATYEDMPHPQAYYFVPGGVSDDTGCSYDSWSLQYCLGSASVYLGEDSVWEQYSVHGDAAPVVVLAHEVTHHFQNMVRMAPPQVANDQIRYENQADCGAGAFMNRAFELGQMNPADDIRDLAGSLVAAAEMEGDGRTHGTIQERLEAFDRGYLASETPPLAACVGFVPEQPIVSLP